jgi:ATP-dependent DNA helicase RecG
MDWHEAHGLLSSMGADHVVTLPQAATPRRIAEWAAALANGEGGAVVLGATSPSCPLEDGAAVLERALDALLMCEPALVAPVPVFVGKEGAPEAVLVQIPAGLRHVYAVDGRYLVRAGARVAPLSSLALKQLLVARGQVSYDAEPLPGASYDDLDGEAIAAYLARIGNPRGLPVNELLRQRGCLYGAEARPTVAGVLLFGRQPDRWVRSSEILAVRYAGQRMSDRFVREDIRGPLPEQIRRAVAFALGNMRRAVELSGVERLETTEYPEEAVREAIVNAVAHRDYALAGDGIRLLLFSDRLEVHSPGRLPGHVTVANIRQERCSRNEVIVQVLADLGFIERLGYGIDRMIDLLADAGLPPPEFRETAGGFVVTLRSASGQLLEEPEPTAVWRHAGYNARQAALLTYLDTHEYVSNREYRELCPDVSAETLRRDLADLVRRGVLLRIGAKRGTVYARRQP